MTTIHDLLDEYAQMARDTREKGLLLERLARAYLTTDPVWTARFEDVWLWQDWPGRNGKVETGVDLIAKERYGDGFCVNDLNDWADEHDDPEYILNLLKRIVTVSLATVSIVNSLPTLNIREGTA